ncbi:MAG TPA: hypothetical protein VK607_22545 [Kofleriaceae bacterium]|nr:hypothetical protein [Kofleriaceae bacterium]
MRAPWSVIVVCLVAFGGAGRADARGEPHGPRPACRIAPEGFAHAVATRPVLHAISTRVRADDRRRPPGPPASSVPPVALAAALAFRAPPRGALAVPSVAPARADTCFVATGSARGPPIA